jgi:hypothetical protein
VKFSNAFGLGVLFLAVGLSNISVGDEPTGPTRGHSRVSDLMNRVRSTNADPHKPAESVRKDKTFLDGYLDIEFRGALGPADALGDKAIRNRGLVEVYDGQVDERLARMAKLLKSECAPGDFGDAGANDAAFGFIDKLGMGHSKKLQHLKKRRGKNSSAEVRRLALMVFMAKEWTELRRAEDKKLALRVFESEFAENFVNILEYEDSPIVKDIQKKEGQKSLESYQEFIKDMLVVTEALGKQPASSNTKNAPQAISELGRVFSKAGLISCPASDRIKGLLAEQFASTLQDVQWTDQNRGTVLDYILGEQPEPEPEQDMEFMFKGKQLHLPRATLEQLQQFDKGGYRKGERGIDWGGLRDRAIKEFQEAVKEKTGEPRF